MRVGIATDHGGFGLKEELADRLRAAGHEVVDFGAHSLNPDDDYPDFLIPLARAVGVGTVGRGVARAARDQRAADRHNHTAPDVDLYNPRPVALLIVKGAN